MIRAKKCPGAHLLSVGHLLICRYPFPILSKARPAVSGSLIFTNPGIHWEVLTVGFQSGDYCFHQDGGGGMMMPEAVN